MTDGIKILYVDDEPINLKLFEINFRKKYNVLLAENGLLGLDTLKGNPDTKFVISDMKMPEMNGIEFIKKAKVNFPDIKFYILTGFDITEDIQHALNTGMIMKYFRKPFNMKEIESSISSITK